MRKPISVTIEWSESEAFRDGENMPFAMFELRALGVAMRHKTGGYLKTKVQVLFDCGETYTCRLDLAKDDTHGFRHHADAMVRNWDKRAAKEPNDHVVSAYRDCVDFLKSIDWTVPVTA